MAKEKTELHFSRFEFKFILPLKLSRELEGELGYFMELDPYVSKQRHQKYFVRSLYFDNDLFTHYYEKIDGLMIRRKYRIRTYTDKRDEEAPIFLEVKGRYNALVYKHRFQLPRGVVKDLEGGRAPFMANLMKLDTSNPVLSAFLFDSMKMRLNPKMLIDYERRPYVSKYAPDFRVTFDDKLESTPTTTLFGGYEQGKKFFLPGFSIVEVKFKRHVPSWFHRLIQSYELRRVSVSKYCKGVEKNGLADNLE